MDKHLQARRMIASRRDLIAGLSRPARHKAAAEGGCGALGLACNAPVAGRHVVEAAAQMHNRGNGKGGGVALAGLDPTARREVERIGLAPFDLMRGYRVPTLDDWRDVPALALSEALSLSKGEAEGLEVRPPDVWRYFARVKPAIRWPRAGPSTCAPPTARWVMISSTAVSLRRSRRPTGRSSGPTWRRTSGCSASPSRRCWRWTARNSRRTSTARSRCGRWRHWRR